MPNTTHFEGQGEVFLSSGSVLITISATLHNAHFQVFIKITTEGILERMQNGVHSSHTSCKCTKRRQAGRSTTFADLLSAMEILPHAFFVAGKSWVFITELCELHLRVNSSPVKNLNLPVLSALHYSYQPTLLFSFSGARVRTTTAPLIRGVCGILSDTVVDPGRGARGTLNP